MSFSFLFGEEGGGVVGCNKTDSRNAGQAKTKP